jgi:hypothetical protein
MGLGRSQVISGGCRDVAARGSTYPVFWGVVWGHSKKLAGGEALEAAISGPEPAGSSSWGKVVDAA